MLNLRFGCRRWQTSLLYTLFSVFVLVALAGFTAQKVDAGTPLTAMVPLDSPVTIAVDTPWLWKNTADLRAVPEVSNALQAAEKSLGFSLETDLFLWSGQSALVLSDINDDGPSFALLMQIRDAEHMIAAPRLEALLQMILPHKAPVTWLAMAYKGVAIRRTEIPDGGSVLKVAIASMDDWLVITFGDGVIRKMVDTHNGDSPSLATHPSFVRATSSLPEGAVGQIFLNGQGILALIKQHDAKMALQLSDTELGHFFLAGEMRVSEKDLLLDSTYCTTATKTQQMLKTLRTDAGIVTGASLAQMPQGTFATILLRNPDKWVGALETLILSFADDDETRNGMQETFDTIGGLRAMLKLCAGEMGLNIAWREGTGFGATLAGETNNAGDATTAAANMASFLKNFQLPVEKTTALYTIPPTKMDEKVFSSLVCWTAREQWFVAASHPNWLTPQTTTPAPALPDIAKDANLVAFGDLSFIPVMVKTLGVADVISMNPALANFNFGQWASAIKIDEDGGAIRCQASGGQVVITGASAMAAAILFPVFSKAREKARQAQSMSNIRQLALALLMATQDNDEKIPVIKTSEDMKGVLGVQPKLLTSPRTNEAYTVNPNISGKSLGSFADSSSIIVFYEKTPGEDGSRCVAFLDGHVEFVQAKDWEAVKQKSKLP